MKTHRLLVSAAAVSFLLVACENPADHTASATVSDAVEVKAPATAKNSVRYVIADGSEILFTGSKVTGSHNGGFKKLNGSFDLAEGALAATGQKVVIDMNSLWSDDDKLTAHLKSGDFFNVEKHPESSFELTGVKSVSGDNYQVSGNLTLNGTSKNITFPATATKHGEAAEIHAKFDINRRDFNIVYDGKADDLIRNEVVIELKLKVVPGAA